jgi:hypothetical protein
MVRRSVRSRPEKIAQAHREREAAERWEAAGKLSAAVMSYAVAERLFASLREADLAANMKANADRIAALDLARRTGKASPKTDE